MNSKISRISYHLPPKILDNAELVRQFGTWTETKILSKTGIRERHVVDGELVSDLAVSAAERLFDAEGGGNRSEIDFLLLVTECPDYFLPATAFVVHEQLGLRKDIGAYDINLGCSGFVYGLATAKGLIAADLARKVLLITADTVTRTIHPMDKSTRTLFGDAAAATLIEASDTDGVGRFVMGSDGSGKDRLIIRAGAWARPSSEATREVVTNRWGNVRSLENLYMDGPSILAFSLEVVPPSVDAILRKNGLNKEDIDLYVFHQASLMLLERLREILDIPGEKFFINIENRGDRKSVV
jgi:3-oxoacyl-[acyl-carrier-protein] synthase-3